MNKGFLLLTIKIPGTAATIFDQQLQASILD